VGNDAPGALRPSVTEAMRPVPVPPEAIRGTLRPAVRFDYDPRGRSDDRVPVRWIAGLFLIAHGLAHAAIWLAPKSTNAPFDPTIPRSSVRYGSLPPRLPCSLVWASLSSGAATFWGNHGGPPWHWHQQPYP